MTHAQIQNIIWYAAIAVGAAFLATGVQLGAVLSGTDPVLWRPLAATFVTTLFGTLTTAAGTAFRPRAGRELSALVKEVGVEPATAALEVEAIKQQTGASATLTPGDVDVVVAAVRERMMREVGSLPRS